MKPRQTPEQSEGGKKECASALHSLQCNLPRRREHAIVLDTVKAKPSVAAKERPALTASPRDGRIDMRSGRKKASGGVEQKK